MDEQKVRDAIAYLHGYIQESIKLTQSHQSLIWVGEECCNTAIEALEKQLTVKTTKFGDFIVYHNCPKCKEFVPLKVNYCCNCGQKLEWSE